MSIQNDHYPPRQLDQRQKLGSWVLISATPTMLLLALGIGLGSWLSPSGDAAPASEQVDSATRTVALKPAVSLFPAPANWRETTHVHGLSVSATDPDVIYVATHHGLLQRSQAGKWFWVGEDRADHMGFTSDPAQANRFYRSGHPATGGNLGFQISDDQGETWQSVSMPGVDFHALAIAPSDPKILYGWAASGARGLFLSRDGGKTWTQPPMAGLTDAPFGLAVDPQDPQRVFATTRLGLFESRSSGDEWTGIPSTQNAPVVGLALQREGEALLMVGYRALQTTPGLYRSTDNGQTWDLWGTGFEGALLRIAISPQDPDIYYAVNQNNQIYRSQDQGKTWQELS
ncbi:MAG: hypothetical protein NW237_11280 [Cyanobacteriota bacterium]|nr:hypothetical protein [Cyanobacteriota bacterium]